MKVYKDSCVDEVEFDFENIIPYLKNLVERTRTNYEILTDPLLDKIQYLPEYKRIKYNKLMVNIIAHLDVLSRVVKKEVEDLNTPHYDFESDIEINYIRN